jgi:RimJ/RimL family protein N-acetyltransferase
MIWLFSKTCIRPLTNRADVLIAIKYMTKNYLNLKIQNEKIQLMPITLSNNQDILIHNKGNVREFFIQFESMEKINEWIIEQRQKMEIGEKIELVIVDIQTNNFIGMVSLDNLEKDVIEPRIWIAEKFQNMGYGKSALKLLIEWYMTTENPKQIQYIADVHNENSKKLAISIGLKFSREFVDEDGDEVVEYLG